MRALIAGGADPKLTNGDGVTAMAIAVVNDRFDLAKTLLDLGADANDGSLYFAVDMHDATTDMRAKDGSRLRADFDNTLTALDLVKLLLDRGADPNKAFVGRLHHSTLCCDAEINASPFYPRGTGRRRRSAEADDRQGRAGRVEPDGSEEGTEARCAGRRRHRPRQPQRRPDADDGGDQRRPRRGVRRRAWLRSARARRRSARRPTASRSRRSRCCWPPAPTRTPRRPTARSLLHQAVAARQVPIIRALVAAGAKLDAVNKDNLTPLLLAEKPEPPPPPGNNADARTYRPKRNTREEMIAAVRELMGLKADDPAPQPPPLPPCEKKKDETRSAERGRGADEEGAS